MRYFFFFTALFFLSARAQDYSEYGIDTSQTAPPKGLPMGSIAPDFNGSDQDGNRIRLKSLLKKGPLVLIFYRGQWCPVCNAYLKTFQDSLSLITQRGAQVIAVSPETVENARETQSKTKLTVPILSDTSQKIMKDYGVFFHVTGGYDLKIKVFLFTSIASNNGKDDAYLPVPATYIIDTDGKIVWRQFDINYKNRASVRSILKNLPGTKGKS